MNTKNTVKKTAALLLGLALTVGSTGCNFITTDSEKDLNQIVATVDISDSLENDETYSQYADDVAALISDGWLAKDIYKSELVAYFLSVGMTYMQSYGYSAEDTFNMLMTTLVQQKIMTQYAVAYYLAEENGANISECEAYVEANLDESADADRKALMKKVLTLKYFLTENGEEMDDYNFAEYSLKQSINGSLDSIETSYVTASDEEHDHASERTTPTGVDTAKEDYYPQTDDEVPALDYDIYTGRNNESDCGTYEKIEGSTTATRKKAYNAFLANLQDYNLVKDNENTSVVTDLDYYYVELANVLGQSLINKYYDDLQESAVAGLTDEYVSNKYTELQNAQGDSYNEDASAFETAIGSVSDDSFVLYGEEGYGFVYNILLPFSASQNQEYSAAKNKGLSEKDLFLARKNILANVKAKDLRQDWFDGHDHANKAFEATGDYYKNANVAGNETNYLFFENNMKKTQQYEALRQYAGMYPYNGVATKDGHEWTFEANKLDIDEFMTEMESYVGYVSGANVKGGKLAAYNDGEYYTADGIVDYSKFMYYEGAVTLSNTNAADFFNAEKNGVKNDAYAALSAVNELMFAYSTDTGCLNTYMGYVVSPYKTSYVPEFEYAAQYAIKKGVGTYVVCGTDYGWHIIYVSFVYDAEDVYGGYNPAEKEIEGTFSNLFYESLKSTTATTHSSEVQSSVLNKYNNDRSVELFKDTYKDLLEMDQQ